MMESQTSDFNVQLKIQKIERTLIGDSTYRGGQSIHALIDGGPYNGIVKMPLALNDEVLSHKEGDEITVTARLTDFSPSLKRPVLEGSSLL